MKTGTDKKLTRKQRLAEIAALNCFLRFSDELIEAVRNRKKFPLDDAQRDALRLTYNRLSREMKRRATGGRPVEVTDKTVEKIAEQIEFKGKEWTVKEEVRTKGIKSIGKLCEKHGTTYKYFWRRWQKQQAEAAEQGTSALEESLERIEILRRLAGSEVARGKQDRADLSEIAETVRYFPARLRATSLKPQTPTQAKTI